MILYHQGEIDLFGEGDDPGCTAGLLHRDIGDAGYEFRTDQVATYILGETLGCCVTDARENLEEVLRLPEPPRIIEGLVAKNHTQLFGR